MEKISYITSLLTFYIKATIQRDQNFITFKKPNTILGLIPLGSKKQSFPVTQLSSVESNFKLKLGRLLMGLLIMLIGLALITEEEVALGLLLIIIGANHGITAFEIRMTVKMSTGEAKTIPFFIFEKGKADLAEDSIRKMISDRLDDMNTRIQTDKLVDAISNK